MHTIMYGGSGHCIYYVTSYHIYLQACSYLNQFSAVFHEEVRSLPQTTIHTACRFWLWSCMIDGSISHRRVTRWS